MLGKRYPQGGEPQAQAVLADLAAHPATARHLATKLARHFAGDTPPPAMVARLEQAYLGSGGDLPTVYRAIVTSPEAWVPAPVKFRTPWEWTVASLRALGYRDAPAGPTVGLLQQLGQPTWRPGSPAGYDDLAASWAGPDAVLRRVEAAERLASRATLVDARRLAPRLFPAALADATAQASRARGQSRSGARIAARLTRHDAEVMSMFPNRRQILAAGSLGALAGAFTPRIAFARAAGDKRFVFIIQRGAADGLGTVGAVGDPAFAAARGTLAEDFATGAKLDGTFALHPAMVETAKLYAGGEALFAHAVASPYRDRSHFDGQNVLETGGATAYQVRDGWLNRLLGLLPPDEARAIAVSATVPLALRGPREVASYAPSALPAASDDLLARVGQLYGGDQQLHALWSEAMGTRQLTSDLAADSGRNAAATGALAARLLTPANGARVAMIETGGWDTHAQQRGRLAVQLKGLDALLAALKAGMGPLWADTMVLVATEFGRTVAVNGTGGTDHGTASAAMLLGGGVAGGRVLADWPGLAPARLFDGRDLRPTTDLDAFIAGAVAGHFALDPGRTLPALFPASAGGRAVGSLVRA